MPTTFLSWMMAFGGGVLEGDGYHFLTPKNLAGLTFVKQVYDDGCAWILPPAGDAPAAFAGRQAVFATANLEQLPEYARAMAAANNADSWTVLRFPGPDQAGAGHIWLIVCRSQIHGGTATGFVAFRKVDALGRKPEEVG